MDRKGPVKDFYDGSKKPKKAKCVSCQAELRMDDYICCIDPRTTNNKKPKRTNLCKKCYDKFKSGDKDQSEELVHKEEPNETIEYIDLQEKVDSEAIKLSNKKKKIRKRKKLERKELIKKSREKAPNDCDDDL